MSGKGCRECAGLSKNNIQEVKEEFANSGWVIVGEYINTMTPIDCVCPKGHSTKKSLDCLRISPFGCRECAGQLPVNSKLKRERRNERVKNWREWTPLILERDGYKCVICSSKDGVNAHHLNSYHKFTEERYDLDNGVTLCSRHHGGPFNRVPGSFHMVFGCMNNTKKQFEEYYEMCINGEID